jgi:uncharacterized membrane protein
MSDEEWLNTDIDAGDATGEAAAALLEAVSETLRDAPKSKRYDIELDVTERDVDE